jgi:hypothetical protein
MLYEEVPFVTHELAGFLPEHFGIGGEDAPQSTSTVKNFFGKISEDCSK